MKGFDTTDIAARTVASIVSERRMLEQRVAQDEAALDRARHEHAQLEQRLRDVGCELGHLRAHVRDAEHRVDMLCAAIAPCVDVCGENCSQKRLCELARRYVNPAVRQYLAEGMRHAG